MIILKISAFTIVSVFLVTVLKKERPEFALAAQIAAVISVIAYSLTVTRTLISEIADISGVFGVKSEYLRLLAGVLCVCTAAEITSSFCKDSGMTSLSSAVELSGKLIALSMCMPMIRTVFNFAWSLIA
ncbi:MAG: hypothetical protein IJB86_03920 [Clostridia bacterium]|nr:hypothetical protein [Clostridia bacterium]